MKTLKVLLYVFLSTMGCLLLIGVGFWLWIRLDYYLPSEQRVRQQFESHRADYIQFVTLLQKDQLTRFVGSNGMTDIDGIHKRLVPEYSELMNKIGAKNVIIREDGSMEFALWGRGCALCSDSYMGVRYFPKGHKVISHMEWTQTEVTSLDSAKLPQENGSVATGLYVVPIEPEWFIYRFEYQE